MKKEGYNFIGYARKSYGNEDNDTRIRLLKMMCENLKERSLVDNVFVSITSKADELLAERDTKNQNQLDELNVDGNTQGKQIIAFNYMY